MASSVRFARASELEALVQNEVAALERSYNDNESAHPWPDRRSGAASARRWSARPTRSAPPSPTFRSASTQDLTSVSELVSASVNDAAQRITRSLADKGEHITVALGRAGDSMIDAIGDRGARTAGSAQPHQRRSQPHARRRQHAPGLCAELQDRRTDRQDRRYLGRTFTDFVGSARPHCRWPAEDDRPRRHAGQAHRGCRRRTDLADHQAER